MLRSSNAVRAIEFIRILLLCSDQENEEDMLDLAFGLTATSRLGCQLIITDELDGLTVALPAETRNLLLE